MPSLRYIPGAEEATCAGARVGVHAGALSMEGCTYHQGYRANVEEEEIPKLFHTAVPFYHLSLDKPNWKPASKESWVMRYAGTTS